MYWAQEFARKISASLFVILYGGTQGCHTSRLREVRDKCTQIWLVFQSMELLPNLVTIMPTIIMVNLHTTT